MASLSCLLTHLLQADTHRTAFLSQRFNKEQFRYQGKIILRERQKCFNCIFRLHKCRHGNQHWNICVQKHFERSQQSKYDSILHMHPYICILYIIHKHKFWPHPSAENLSFYSLKYSLITIYWYEEVPPAERAPYYSIYHIFIK